MKTKSYKFGKTVCKAYMKDAGHGWECGFIFGGKHIFTGNFIHQREANQWWAMMNREVRTFTKKFWVGQSYPKSWYCNFLKHTLYKCYYNFINRMVTGYNRSFTTLFNRDHRRYMRLRHQKHWGTQERITLRSKAA